MVILIQTLKKSVVCLLAVVLLSISAFAKTDGEIREKVDAKIRLRHPDDTQDWWRELGSNAPGIVIKMYKETDDTYRQIRLMNGLQWFDDPEAIDFLKRQATDGESAVRITAIQSIGRSQGAKELSFLSSFLAHEDAQTRFSAAKAIQDYAMTSNDAPEILRAYRKGEKEEWVLARLQGKFLGAPERSSAAETSKPIWEGAWVGVALTLDTKNPSTFVSEKANVLIISKDHKNFEGEITVEGKPVRKWKFSRVQLTSPDIIQGGLADTLPRASIVRPILPGGKPTVVQEKADFDFTAKMEQYPEKLNREWVVKAHSNEMGLDLFLRRQPTKQ